MKTSFVGTAILFCGLLVNASPLDPAFKTDSKKLEIKPETVTNIEANNEALNTSNNFGIGYYPIMYNDLYGLNRPEYIAYRSNYGSYGAQWSQYSRYNNYRGYRVYDGYYERPVYTVWG